MALGTGEGRLLSLKGGFKSLFSGPIFPVLAKAVFTGNPRKHRGKIGARRHFAGIFLPDFEFFPDSRELAA